MMRAVRIAVVVFLFAVVVQAAPGGFYWFTSYTYVYENAGTVPFTVYRVSGTTGTVTVDYATVAGTAIAGTDYTATSGTLTFADGETSKTVSLTLIDDTTYHGARSLSLLLSNPTGGATLYYPTSLTVSIQDNDPAPTLSINDVSVTEGNSGTTNAVFTVTRTVPTTETATVQW